MTTKTRRPGPTEKEWMATVVEYARLRGWMVYHTHDSRRSEAGFPDLTLVKGERLMFVELKRDGLNPTPAQQAWLKALEGAGAETYVWRPADWSDTVEVLMR